MDSPKLKLDTIRVQTARMMEIYALLRGELEKNTLLLTSPEERTQLNTSIAIIRTNMRQLLDALAVYQQQQDDVSANEARKFEELLQAVLEWHMANAEGE